MPKQKTHKGLLKRVRVTGSGKVLRQKSFRGHLMSAKSGERRRRLRRRTLVTGRLAQHLKRAICES